MRHRTLGWTLATGVAALFCAPASLLCAHADDASWPGADGGARQGVALLHGAPYAELTIGGVRGHFLVDTGANTSGVDQGWLYASGALHAPVGYTTVGGTTGPLSTPLVAFDRLDLGRGVLFGPVFCAQDFSGFATPGGVRQAGLLGTDFLSSYRLDLDLAHGRMELSLFHERAPLPASLTAVPLTYPYRLPTVAARLGGVEIPCRLDSGAAYIDGRPYLDVNEAAVTAFHGAGWKTWDAGALTVSGVGGAETRRILWVGLPLEIGPARVENVLLVVHGRGTLANEAAPVGLIPASTLARLGRIVVDPFESALYVPSAR